MQFCGQGQNIQIRRILTDVGQQIKISEVAFILCFVTYLYIEVSYTANFKDPTLKLALHNLF
jgi:hypothetical protein